VSIFIFSNIICYLILLYIMLTSTNSSISIAFICVDKILSSMMNCNDFIFYMYFMWLIIFYLVFSIFGNL
jgi:hypothetical protein